MSQQDTNLTYRARCDLVRKVLGKWAATLPCCAPAGSSFEKVIDCPACYSALTLRRETAAASGVKAALSARCIQPFCVKWEE